MRLIFIAVAAFLLSSFAANAGECKDKRCELYRSGKVGILKPHPDCVWIYVEQANPDKVLVTLERDGKIIHTYTREGSANPRVCIGRHWLVGGRTDQITVCNSHYGRKLIHEHITMLLGRGRTPDGNPVCLFSPAECLKKGYTPR